MCSSPGARCLKPTSPEGAVSQNIPQIVLPHHITPQKYGGNNSPTYIPRGVTTVDAGRAVSFFHLLSYHTNPDACTHRPKTALRERRLPIRRRSAYSVTIDQTRSKQHARLQVIRATRSTGRRPRCKAASYDPPRLPSTLVRREDVALARETPPMPT